MSDTAGSVTLIFYKIGAEFWKEPFLNLVAAGFQMSSFTHVELAIGDNAGNFGQMCNVCRVFNDSVGVELTSRTGRNPQYSYLQLGCSKNAEQRMLNYARTLVGKPFSNSGMARSVFFPRTSDGKSFFCAELVASVLKKGGLMSLDSNPGAATPKGLHRMYKDQAAATANPYTLRQFSKHDNMSGVVKDEGIRLMGIGPNSKSSYADGYKSGVTTSNKNRPRSRNDPPPRTSFRCVNGSDSLNSHKNNTSVFVKW